MTMDISTSRVQVKTFNQSDFLTLQLLSKRFFFLLFLFYFFQFLLLSPPPSSFTDT